MSWSKPAVAPMAWRSHGILAQETQRDAVRVVARQLGLGPVRGAAAGGPHNDRFPARGHIAAAPRRRRPWPRSCRRGPRSAGPGRQRSSAPCRAPARFRRRAAAPSPRRWARPAAGSSPWRGLLAQLALGRAQLGLHMAQGQHHLVGVQLCPVQECDVEAAAVVMVAATRLRVGGVDGEASRCRAAWRACSKAPAQVAAVEGPAGEVRGGERGKFGAVPGAEHGRRRFPLGGAPSVERAARPAAGATPWSGIRVGKKLWVFIRYRRDCPVRHTWPAPGGKGIHQVDVQRLLPGPVRVDGPAGVP